MKLYYDDEERALLAARLGHDPDVSDAELGDALKDWIEGSHRAGNSKARRPLTYAEAERIQSAVADTGPDYSGGRGRGYADDPNYYGVG